MRRRCMIIHGIWTRTLWLAKCGNTAMHYSRHRQLIWCTRQKQKSTNFVLQQSCAAKEHAQCPNRRMFGCSSSRLKLTTGQTYHQEKDEIHESLPFDGTVTLVTRTFTADRDHARVFWRGTGDFVTAEPRAAT